MPEERPKLREDFEFARNWLEQLDYYRDIDFLPPNCVWRSSRPYNILSRRKDEESEALLQLFKKAKGTALNLGRVIEEYHDVTKHATLKDFVDYLEDTFINVFKEPLVAALKEVGEIPQDLPTEEEAIKLLSDHPEDKYIICRNNIITDAEYLLDTINNVINWANNIKKSGLLLRNKPEEAERGKELSQEMPKSGGAGGGIKQTSEINKTKGGLLMATAEASKENWEKIKNEYDCSKLELAKKINFVKDEFKRKIILRDVEHAFVLASYGFAKPAVILAGGVIEELLKEFLKYKKVKPKGDRFTDYIKACENNRLLKLGISRLSDAIRDFRNLVHISREESKRYTLSKATAIGAVSSIFTIANDFQ